MLTKDQPRKRSLQYITNEQGEKTTVILPIEEFKESKARYPKQATNPKLEELSKQAYQGHINNDRKNRQINL